MAWVQELERVGVCAVCVCEYVRERETHTVCCCAAVLGLVL